MFYIKKLLFLSFLLAISSVSLAQESGVSVNEEGKDFASLKHTWAARWITHPTASTMDYGVFLFRQNFELPTVPSQFIIYVSADNRYKLFINGQQVAAGPARGDINHWRYETIDIAQYLQEGQNIIAAEVVNFGEFKHAAQHSFQTAFILQGHKENPINIDTDANSNWKVFANKAYNYTPFLSDSLGGYYAAGPGDILDAALYPWGWKEEQFSDIDWKKPRAATVEFAVGRGFLYGSTWYLVPRAIPFMEAKPTRITKVVRSEGMSVNSSIFNGNQSLTIPANSKVSILLDQTHHTVGYPEMLFSKGKESKIKITYAEALFYKNSTSHSAHGGWEKGHRNEFEDKEIRGYYDIVYPDGGDERHFSPLALRVYRFIQLDIETKENPLVINDFYGVYTAYPFELKAKFTVDNELLTKIWETSWRTLRNSSQETFLDPYYEQLQYIGDSRIQAMAAIYATNDDLLMRKAIQSFDDSRLPMGLTASRFPSYIVQVIPTYSLIWVDMIYDYFMYREDVLFLKQFLPGMVTVLDWFARHIDETGLLANLEWWNFTDWTKGFQNGIPPGADDGHSANVSIQYVYALQNAIPVFRHFGWEAEANKYEAIAKKLQKAILATSYDGNKKLIAETPEKDLFSQHTNIFAILTGTIPVQDHKGVMEQILADTSLIQTSIYFKFYLVRALQKAGMGEAYFNQLGPWKFMLEQGLTTFGETDINPRSDCHGWSATPNFDFLHTIAGIQPASAGFKTVLIQPNFGPLPDMNVVFPHPKGLIKMELKRRKNGKAKGQIILPDGLTGNFDFMGKQISLTSGVNTIK